MKQIVWRIGPYKYQDALIAHINNVAVAVVSTTTSGKVNGKILLPGLPKRRNSFRNVVTAKATMEALVNEWFAMVEK